MAESLGIELNSERFVELLRKLIGESEHVQVCVQPAVSTAACAKPLQRTMPPEAQHCEFDPPLPVVAE